MMPLTTVEIISICLVIIVLAGVLSFHVSALQMNAKAGILMDGIYL